MFTVQRWKASQGASGKLCGPTWYPLWIILTLKRDNDYLFMCVSDLLFGVPGKYTGVSHYNRKRVVTYTITIVLSVYDAK